MLLSAQKSRQAENRKDRARCPPSFDGIRLTYLQQNKVLRTDDTIASSAVGSNSLVLLVMVTWVNDLEEMRRKSSFLYRAFFPVDEICSPLLQPIFGYPSIGMCLFRSCAKENVFLVFKRTYLIKPEIDMVGTSSTRLDGIVKKIAARTRIRFNTFYLEIIRPLDFFIR